ncbi:MAG: hypothetical protein ACREMN_13235 [Gemmatimonadales bacterium]
MAYRRRLFLVAFFFFALFFFALFFFALFFRALGRAFLAAFFFFFALRAFGRAGARVSSRRGAGAGAGIGLGGGAEGIIGSMNPGPGQLLSMFSIGSSIGSSPPLVWAGRLNGAYSLSRDCDPASDARYRLPGQGLPRRP